MSQEGIAVSYLIVAVGVGLLYYFAKRRTILGVFLGILCVVMGALVLGGPSGIVPIAFDVYAAFAVVFVAVITSYFITGRKSRTLLLLAIPASLLALYLL